MAVNVKEKPTDFVVSNFFRVQFLSSTSPHYNRRTLKFAILHLRQTFLKILNSQKCWTKTQYRELRGSCDCDRGNWVTKISAKKIKLKFSIFFSRHFHHLISPVIIAGSSNLRYCVVVQQLLIGEIG